MIFPALQKHLSLKLSVLSIVGIVTSMILSLFIVTHIFNKFEQEALQNIHTSLITNNTKYVKNHLQATTHKIEQLIEKKYTDINILAQVMQELIDHPDK